MKWNSPKDKLPEQGKKILCMDHGDFYVAQKFGKYWFSIPFYDSAHCYYEEPELWSEIDFPNNLTGKIFIEVEGEIMDLDSFEQKFPREFNEFIELNERTWGLK